MLRFLPDTWREALLRPVAMAAPDAGVYIEIMAPDFRFVFVLLLLAMLVMLQLVRPRAAPLPQRPSLLLFSVITLAFIPWLITTANGRYFIALLLVVGPLCIALVWMLPMTRGFRLSIALVLVVLQGFAVQQSSPWQAWGLARWKEPPFFDIELPQDMLTEPATYVTLSSISYSLIAPRFPAEARWMSLGNAPGAASGTLDGRRAQQFLAEAIAGRLTLLVPTLPAYSTPDGMPDVELLRVLNTQLAPHRLQLGQPHGCRVLRSRGLASLAARQGAELETEKAAKFGFWACSLKYPVDAPVIPNISQAGVMGAVFSKVEQQCPRFFPPGRTATVPIAGGEMRSYPESEMKLYALDSGDVLYKYYRAMNPVKIGSISDILRGDTKIDCSNIRGRSGLPWEREI